MLKSKTSRLLRLIMVMTFATILFKCVIFIGIVPSESMENTISKGSIIICNRLISTDNLKRNDIVVFKNKSGKFLIKRIIAIEGDKLVIEKDRVILNSKTLNEDFVKGKTLVKTGRMIYNIPKKAYFVMGDNREHSLDSRESGGRYLVSNAIIAKYITGFKVKN